MEKNSEKDDRIQELVNEYRELRSLFAEYAKKVHFLLENLLRQHDAQFQTVQPRTKEVSAFHEKLLGKKQLQSKKLFEMTDLAGCRVIFYFEEDMEQFARILYNEFEVVSDEVKISPNEYNARHIIVRLRENRFNLPEYSNFKGLQCEIQLTTVLYHAWAEIQHDIIYKPNKELLEFDKPTFDYIDSYFKEIMEKHLKEASKGFSFIYYAFDKIKKGHFVISPNIINTMSKSASNNEMYLFLKLLDEYVGKYAHKLPRDYKLVDALEIALSSIAEKNPKAIINFFHERVELYKAKKITEPIPFEFLVLNTALSKNHKEILPEIIEWVSEDSLENWYASKLIENIFPSFGSDLECFLLSLVQKNDAKNLKIVLYILEKYEGEAFLYAVVKEIIKLYPMDETLKARLYQILSGIKGIVGGEYGFLDAYKLKREQIKEWLNDSNSEVKKFAVDYYKYLDELINHEKSRVDRQIAFRKREFDIERI